MKKTPIAVCAVIAALSIYISAYASSDDDFNWQNASREMDALPFSPRFIDSVTLAHIGGPVPAGLRSAKPGGFINGETLVFEVVWGPFKAGYLILEARNMRGRGLIRLGAKAMTSNAISAIYKLRDYSLSWVDPEGMYPHFFEQHIREGSKYRADSYTVYDPKNAKLFHRRRTDVQEHDAPLFTHDFLSLIYYARTQPLNPGDRFETQMFARPKTDAVKFRVHDKREKVQVGAGTFNCVIVEPAFTGDTKAFNRKSKIEIWVTDDERKIPVMVRSKAKFGSVSARLVHIAN